MVNLNIVESLKLYAALKKVASNLKRKNKTASIKKLADEIHPLEGVMDVYARASFLEGLLGLSSGSLTGGRAANSANIIQNMKAVLVDPKATGLGEGEYRLKPEYRGLINPIWVMPGNTMFYHKTITSCAKFYKKWFRENYDTTVDFVQEVLNTKMIGSFIDVENLSEITETLLKGDSNLAKLTDGFEPTEENYARFETLKERITQELKKYLQSESNSRFYYVAGKYLSTKLDSGGFSKATSPASIGSYLGIKVLSKTVKNALDNLKRAWIAETVAVGFIDTTNITEAQAKALKTRLQPVEDPRTVQSNPHWIEYTTKDLQRFALAQVFLPDDKADYIDDPNLKLFRNKVHAAWNKAWENGYRGLSTLNNVRLNVKASKTALSRITSLVALKHMSNTSFTLQRTTYSAKDAAEEVLEIVKYINAERVKNGHTVFIPVPNFSTLVKYLREEGHSDRGHSGILNVMVTIVQDVIENNRDLLEKIYERVEMEKLQSAGGGSYKSWPG